MAQLEFQFARIWDPRALWLGVARQYLYAFGLVLVAFALRFAVDPLVHGSIPYVTFLVALLLMVPRVGVGPAITAVFLSVLLAHWFFVPPEYTWFHDAGDWLDGAAFVVAGMAIVLFARWAKSALERERRVSDALQIRARELAASEELNRRILASSADSIELLSLDGNLASISEGGKRLLGVSDASKLLRKPWVMLWPEEYRHSVSKALATARKGEHACFQARRERGTDSPGDAAAPASWFEVVLAPIHDQHGRPERLLAVARDVTERRTAEEARAVSEQRREMVMSAIGDAVWDVDVERDTMIVNESFEKAYGHPVDCDWKQWWTHQIHPKDCERVLATFESSLSGTAINWSSEYRVRRSNGSWAHVLDRASIARDQNGKALRAVGAMIDLTRLMRAERRMQLLAKTSSSLLCTDSPQEVVDQLCSDVLEFLEFDTFINFLVDDASGRLKLNASGGLTPEQNRDLQWLDFGAAICGCVAIDGRPVVQEDLQNSTDPRAELAKNFGLQAYACNPLVVQGRVIGTLSFGTRRKTSFDHEEISLMKAVADQVAIAMDRQRASLELLRVNADLEKRVTERTKTLSETTEQLNSFCYSVAHDLRAPLRTQTGFARLLLDEYESLLDENGRYYLRAIMQSAERQANIIQDLMAHVNVSRADLPTEAVSLSTALEQVRADLEVELQQKHAVIDVESIDSEAVLANRSSLHLVLLNLISNACKFVAPGVEPKIRVRTETGLGDRLRLWVEDNGIGIDSKDAGRLFGMFQRLQKGSYPGTGMGLAIVKTAVERMGGSVGFESTLGKGSRFWIELPLDHKEEIVNPRYAQQLGGGLRR